MPRPPNKRRWRAPAAKQRDARTLRRDMTSAEKALWRRLRGGQLDGAHFRKQHAVGPFIVDFFCARSDLAIEIDGDTHAEKERYDAARTRWLCQQKRYRVIRFTNEDVHHRIDAVLEVIAEALKPHR